MSITATQTTRFKGGRFFKRLLSRALSCEMGTIAFDSSYPTGGEAVTFNMGTVVKADIGPMSGYVFEYLAGSILVYRSGNTTTSPLVEAATGTDLSGLTAVPYVVWGYD
jgi:hypothetical protein